MGGRDEIVYLSSIETKQVDALSTKTIGRRDVWKRMSPLCLEASSWDWSSDVCWESLLTASAVPWRGPTCFLDGYRLPRQATQAKCPLLTQPGASRSLCPVPWGRGIAPGSPTLWLLSGHVI